MKYFSLLFSILSLLAISSYATSTNPPANVNIDGIWYTQGQIAYIDCSKTSINVYIQLIVEPGGSYSYIHVNPSSNFTVSNTASNLMKTLHLDPAKQNGFIDVSYQAANGNPYTRIYIMQKPPAPTIPVTPNICSGTSQSITAISSYNFQSTNPQNLVWQTTGGVTVNGSTSYIQPAGLSSTVTIANSASGSYSVKAVTPSCGNLESNATTVVLGPAVITNPNYWLFDSFSNMWQFSQTPAPGVSYNFYVSSGSAQLNQQSQDCYITTSGGATVCVTGTNSCGTGNPFCFYIPPAGGMLKTVFPNPVTSLLSLEFHHREYSDNIPFEVFLYSEKSLQPIIRLTTEEIANLESFNLNHKIEMDVGSLPRGTYFIHIVADRASKLPLEMKRVVLH